MVGDEAGHVFLGRQGRIEKLYRRHRLAGDELDGICNRLAAHLLRLLRGCHVEHALAQRLECRGVAVKTADDDLLGGIADLDGLRGAERKSVGLCEDDGDIRIGLQHVLHDLEAFVLEPVIGILFGDDLHIRIGLQRFRATLGAVELGRRALLAVDDDHLALAASFLEDVVANGLCRSNGVRCKEGVARRAVGIAVDVDNRDARLLGKLYRNGCSCGTCRNVDQGVDVLRQEVLYLVDLGRAITLRIDRDNLDAALLGFGLDSLLDLIEEVCLQVGDGETDLLSFLGLKLARILLASAAVLAVSLGSVQDVIGIVIVLAVGAETIRRRRAA